MAKPAHTSSAEVLEKLQCTFRSSRTFAELLEHQPKRPSKSDEQPFKLGHGGTLDPLAAGVLIVGIGRGTKHLQQYLACSKTYETVVLFGASTDTYDCVGTITHKASSGHITKELVEAKLAHFRGTIQQTPPIYSALKINGVKACEYARRGEMLPRQLETREMRVSECNLLDWLDAGTHPFAGPFESLASAPAVRVRLTVSSGFYVRSFAHDLGLACQSRSHMASLLRTRQAHFTSNESSDSVDLTPAITFADLDAGEDTWGPKIISRLNAWAQENPLYEGHINGRDQNIRSKLAAEKENRPKQRFRGGWVAETKQDRIKQQGGKFKGKWSRKAPGTIDCTDGTRTSQPTLTRQADTEEYHTT